VEDFRLAVVSDIHGNLPALEAVVADLRQRGVDAVVNLGDSLSGPLYPRETAQYLMEQDWVQLAGNHERQILNERAAHRGASDEYARSCLTPVQLEWIASLRPSRQYAPDVLLCHGTPSSDLVYLIEMVESGRTRIADPAVLQERLGPSDAALVVCGHSHTPRSVRSLRGQLVVNPGSVGLPGFDADYPTPHVVENGSPDARYAIVERRNGKWTSSLLAVSYDYKPVAELARQRGREEWYRLLMTGYAH
jgi:putative phosphoesterase